MPKYHNLEGWMRDVRRAITDGSQVAYELAELLLDVDDLVDSNVAGSVEAGTDDDTDHTPDDHQDGVDSQGQQGREADAPRPRRHDARSALVSTQASRLGGQLDLVPGSVGVPTEPQLAEVRTGPLGPSIGRVTRASRMAAAHFGGRHGKG